MSQGVADRLQELPAEQRARLMAALRERAVQRAAPSAIPRRDPSVPAPLSFEQRRLWIVNQLDPGSPAYNETAMLRLNGGVDAALLARALGDVRARHEILRTTFHAAEGGPVQVVHPPSPVPLRVEDLSALPEDARAGAAERVAGDALAAPFDLAAGPLLRALLLRLGADDAVVVLVMHHMVTDGTSKALLTRELRERYGALAAGRAEPLPELPLQFGDWAAWQHQWVRQPEFAAHLDFWTRALDGAPELLELPTDRPRPPVASRRGAARPLHLPRALADALRDLAVGEGCTLFIVLLAAWQALLARYAGQDDVVVGTTAANRTREETEGLMGPFFNVLALRGDLSGDPTVRELLARLRRTTLGAYEHQSAPFEKVVEAVRPARSLSHEPLFQVLFELQNGAGPGAPLPPAPSGPAAVHPSTGAAKYDLTLIASEHQGGITGTLEYATDLFDPATADRLLAHYRVLLEGFAAHPGRRLSELGLLRDGERATVVDAWNRTAHPYPHACIHALFEAQAARTPDAVAVVHADGRMTYAALDGAANRVAHLLRARGIGPEDRVALCLERGMELLPAFFGILKAGAAYVPLDPTHPADRLGYMLADSGARMLLSQSWLADRLPADRPETLFLDAVADEIAALPADRPKVDVTPENLAYVYYTSGSTGRPKGVAMHHYGPANYFAWGAEAYRAADGRGAPVFSSMAVDLTLANFIPLFRGARVELLREGPGVEALAEAIRREPGFSMIKITPTHLALLNGELSPGDAARSTGTLVIGADNLLAEPTRFWQRHAPTVRLLNEYGPTETVVGCSLYEMPAGRHTAGRIPIGRPIWNITMYVLDGHMRPVPPGVPGELYIGGIGVARGYLGRPGLTAEKFVPDPFAPAPGARLYRTGDLARFLEGGDIEFLGRMDFQVKIRGYRIETGEIENVLAAQPGVRDVLVMARADGAGGLRLVAYVAGDAAAHDAEALRRVLRRTLPEYMVPAAWVFLDRFPVGSTGKIDRRSLPEPAAAERTDGDGYAAPRTETERALVDLWQEVLSVARVGVDDDFFALGGHSMLALRAMTEVRRRFGAELPLSALFEHPTVAGLARLLDGAGDETADPSSASPLVALQPHGDRVPLFFVHPVGGQVLCYTDLARHLGPDQPFYALQARDLAAAAGQAVTVEAMAAEYVAAIRRARPHGPYLLGGWSFGAFVAFEMARQLADAGQAVPLVALLDPDSPEQARRTADVEEAVLLAHLAREQALQAGRALALTAGDLRPLDAGA
ncbi:amino acid adenylation domain-containing protein, partial [Longimicrobium sp.]|uniref:amino acid adenylation domain-containing protein n=1 Tax=Longimicrobium sp. TaxID=2029185 RepID=UPI002E361EA7